MASQLPLTPGDPSRAPGPERRILFLDDDPERAAAFLENYPSAVWVQTVDECLKRLEEEWNEVHLDHDLGGERFVRVDREDCGMEVVRWLCLVPHPHLMKTRFFVHSHNENAASMMISQMKVAGFRVAFRPFGSADVSERFSRSTDDLRPPPRGFIKWLGDILRSMMTPKYAPLADDESKSS